LDARGDQRYNVAVTTRRCSEMECELAENGKYVLVTFEGPMTAELGRQLGKDIVVFSEKHQLKKFLFDMRKSVNVENVSTNYEFASKDIFDFAFPLDSYSAFLIHPDDHSHYFITAAFKESGFNVEIFVEKELAVEWLEMRG
jgi:hypothetical protein